MKKHLSIVKMMQQHLYFYLKQEGKELREYIHIKDAARASVEILSGNFKNANIMITGSKSMRIHDVLDMITEMFNEKIKVEYTNNVLEAHYNITPYTFKPKVAKKYQLNYYHDLGQGVLEVVGDGLA